MDAATGDTVDTLRGHRDVVRDIRFSPDGSLVGAAPGDYELIVWETATGRLLERWDIFDRLGRRLQPRQRPGLRRRRRPMLRTWDLSVEDTYLQQTTQVGDAEVFTHADISPDGQQVAYTWLDDQDRGWVRFVDTVTGDATSPVRFPVWDLLFWVNAVDAWHPDGGQYAGFWCDNVEPCARPGTVTVLDSATGQPLRKPRDIVDGDGDILSLGYVDEGRSLLAVDSDDQILIVDAENLRPSSTYPIERTSPSPSTMSRGFRRGWPVAGSRTVTVPGGLAHGETLSHQYPTYWPPSGCQASTALTQKNSSHTGKRTGDAVSPVTASTNLTHPLSWSSSQL